MKAVHIGFPKTATTLLQTVVFPRLEGRRCKYVPLGACATLFSSLIADDDTVYDPEATASRLRASIGGMEEALFSYEALTGHHYPPGFANRSQIARRLKQLGIDRVLITIRNQFDILESAYKQYLGSGGVLRFRDYVKFDPEERTLMDPRYFDYHLLHDLYATLFGASNVLLLQYERLREPRFVRELTDFLGVCPVTVDLRPRLNQSLSREKMTFLRLCNHVTYSSLLPSSLVPKRLSSSAVSQLLGKLPLGNSSRSFHDDSTRDSVASFYAESNQRLAKAAQIELTSHYPGFGELMPARPSNPQPGV